MIKRYTHYALTIILSIWITSGTAHGKLFVSKPAALESPEIRALAVGFENGLENLEILDAKLKPVGQLALRQFGFSKAFTCPIVEGKIRFGVRDGSTIIGKKKYRLVASLDWKDSYKQVCLLFIPKSLTENAAQDAAEYTIQIMDMSTQSFGLGHTKIINLTPNKSMVSVGEHKTTVEAWSESQLSKVKERSNMNMAQVGVSYMKEGTEHDAFQSRMRYLETTRYITFIYTDTKKDRIAVRIVKDSGRLFK